MQIAQILSCFKISSTRLLKASAYRYKKERYVFFKICKNAFLAGALLRAPLGELRWARPQSAGEETPSACPAFGARHAYPPQNSSHLYAYVMNM